MDRNKVRKFGQHSPDHATAADGFMVGGAIMAPSPGQIGLSETVGINVKDLVYFHSILIVIIS